MTSLPVRTADIQAIRRATTTINSQIRDRAIRHAVFLERLKNSEAEAILKLLRKDVYPDVRGQLQKRLAAIKTRGFDRGPATTKRVRQQMVAVKRTAEEGFRRVYQKSIPGMHNLARLEADFMVAALRDLPPIQLNVVMPAAATLRSIVTSQPMQGKFLSEWFTNLGSNLGDAIQREMQIGWTLGESIDQMTRRLTGGGGARGLFDGSAKQARATVRTATNHVSTHAREIVYAENEDVIKGVQWVSTLDARTTDICQSLDGEVFKPTKGPRPPIHFQCRSTTIPVLKSWEELNIDLKEAPPGTRASMNGKVPASLNYEQWLRKMESNPATRHIVDEALGRGRAKLWRQGVPVQRFVTDQYRPMTIAQIRAREGLNRGTPPGPKPVAPPTSELTGAELRKRMLAEAEAVEAQRPALQAEVDRLHQRRQRLEAKRPVLNDKRAALRDDFSEGRITEATWEAESTKLRKRHSKFTARRMRIMHEEHTAMEKIRHLEAAAQRKAESALRIKADKGIRTEWDTPSNLVSGRSVPGNGYNALADDAVRLHGQAAWDATAREMGIAEEWLSRMVSTDALKQPVVRKTSGGISEASRTRVRVRVEVQAERVINQGVEEATRAKFTPFTETISVPHAQNSVWGSGARTIIHEIGHLLDDIHPATFNKYSQQFLKRRTAGEAPQKLQKLYPRHNYKANEVARPDKFRDAYMGKDYGPTASEITSMGLEELFTDPVGFARRDPDYFDFIVNLIRGHKAAIERQLATPYAG